MTRSAFTLVELVIVILTLGILASATLPRYYTWVESNRVQMGASMVVADLNRASTMARTTGTKITIQFNYLDAQYEFVDREDPQRPGQFQQTDLGGSPYFLELVSGPDAISFDEFGNATADAEIVLQSADGQQRAVGIGKLMKSPYIR